MAKIVNRLALEILDGDEVSLNHGPDEYSEWDGAAVVLEKTLAEDGRVLLTLSVDPSEMVRTKIRPREEAAVQLPLFEVSGSVTQC